jgi:hypothetical protein
MKYLPFLVLSIVLFAGCSKILDDTPENPAEPKTNITSNKAQLIFDINSGPDTLTINASGEWQADLLSFSTPLHLSRIDNAPDKLVVSTGQELTEGTDVEDLIRIRLKDNADTTALYIPVTRLAASKDSLVLGGEGADELKAVKWIYDGYIAVGYTSSTRGDGAGNHGGKDFWVVKFDDYGKTIWSKTFGGSGDDVATTLASSSVTIDMTSVHDGYLVGGYTNSNDFDVTGNHGSKDAWLIKIDTLGNLVWQQTLGTPGDDEITKIFEGSEGRMFTGTKNGDQWLINYDFNGDVRWEKTFGSSSEDMPGTVIQGFFDDFSNFYFTGSGKNADGDVSDKPTSSTNDAWLVKTNGAGDVLWKSYIGGEGDDRGIAIVPGVTGRIRLFGTTTSSDIFPEFSGDRNLYLAEFDTNNGALLWKKIIKHTDDDDLTDVIGTKTQRLILAGSGRRPNFQGSESDASDGSLIVIDDNGNVLLSRLLGGDKSERLNAIARGRGFQKIVVGSTKSYPTASGTGDGNGWLNWLEYR